jgi:formamidopyrimidine-DNA glycosylase
MPELPEVETVRRGLEPTMLGATFSHVDQRRANLRFPFPARFAERLTGRTVTALGRRAKYLLVDLDDGEVLIMHLGMTGRFLIEPVAESGLQAVGDFHYAAGGLTTHDHVVFNLTSGARVIYNDARRFGYMDLIPRKELETSRHFAKMGIEPLGNALSGDTLAALFDAKSTSLKAALLDQSMIAGLGNIYVSEALFRAGLHPASSAGSIATTSGQPKPVAHLLAQSIRDVLSEAVEAGGSTLRDFAHADGSLGYFQHAFRVYGREGAACVKPDCSGHVLRITQSGRSTFFCGKCQLTS